MTSHEPLLQVFKYFTEFIVVHNLAVGLDNVMVPQM